MKEATGVANIPASPIESLIKPDRSCQNISQRLAGPLSVAIFTVGACALCSGLLYPFIKASGQQSLAIAGTVLEVAQLALASTALVFLVLTNAVDPGEVKSDSSPTNLLEDGMPPPSERQRGTARRIDFAGKPIRTVSTAITNCCPMSHPLNRRSATFLCSMPPVRCSCATQMGQACATGGVTRAASGACLALRKWYAFDEGR